MKKLQLSKVSMKEHFDLQADKGLRGLSFFFRSFFFGAACLQLVWSLHSRMPFIVGFSQISIAIATQQKQLLCFFSSLLNGNMVLFFYGSEVAPDKVVFCLFCFR
jgi:hypothetical protein